MMFIWRSGLNAVARRRHASAFGHGAQTRNLNTWSRAGVQLLLGSARASALGAGAGGGKARAGIRASSRRRLTSCRGRAPRGLAGY
jgi:hypothetical protein